MSETFVKPFVKHGSAPGAAAAEAAYLRWLREGSAAVVEVLALDEDANTLTIEKVEPVRPTVDAARQAGRELAAIHAMGAAAFGAPADGWDGPNFIGTRQQRASPPSAGPSSTFSSGCSRSPRRRLRRGISGAAAWTS